MAIRWDPPDTQELIDNIEENKSLTVCPLQNLVSKNTLFLILPQTFPDLSSIEIGQIAYFADINSKIILSLKPIAAAKIYTRHLQRYGPNTTNTYYRMPIPIQLRKHYGLDKCKHAHLIKQGDHYECVFI